MTNMLIFNLCVILVAVVSLAAGSWTISGVAEHDSAPGTELEVRRVRRGGLEVRNGGQGAGFLKRAKRRWSPPPFNILENDAGPFPKPIDRLVSDSEQTHKVYYTISGPGVDQHPTNVFSLDSKSGMLSLLKSVDREEFPSFTLLVRVFDINTNRETDQNLPITIEVDDVNDNAPTFKDPLRFTVDEQSPIGSIVGMVNATDRDKPGSLHVKIRYSLLSGTDLFAIHPETGVITTTTNTLDREIKDTHEVKIEIKDMAGAVSGKANTGTATIVLNDINDNPPTFTKTKYNVVIPENKGERLVLRIPVNDKDLVNTPNWISKFVVTKGNENGNFRMETDPKTNEGLLYVSKALDFEKTPKVDLEITAKNEAELKGTSAQWLSIPVNVAVGDIDEGPEFTAPIVRYVVKENIPNGTVIGTYKAVDPETKSSNGITYFKTSDPAGWISVNKDTGELRVANTIDRESHFVQDGIYNVSMKAVDASSKTGTGMVIIKVEDMNDNVPTLPDGDSDLVVCEKEGQMGSVVIVAEDKDQSPFGAPFTFQLLEDHDGKWAVNKLNDTAATLQHVMALPTGMYEVPVLIRDLQGLGSTQTARVRICECRNGVCLDKDRSAVFGGLGILAMLLPLLLLLLLGLLLAIFCATKREKIQLDDAGDSGGILLTSNIEAPGDEVDASLINMPIGDIGGGEVTKGSVKDALLNTGWAGNLSTVGGQSVHENGIYKNGVSTTNMQGFYSSQYEGQQFGGQSLGTGMMGYDYGHVAQDSAFLHTWKTNGLYLHQKLGYFGTEGDGRYADDIVHAYGYEGAGSSAGSVGCCSDYADNETLDFLNTLGPKFNTLADVCRKT